MMSFRYLLITLFFLCCCSNINAQEFLWDVNFDNRFDNREYSGMELVKSETLYGVRLSPQIGLGWGDRIGEEPIHRIMVGGDVFTDFGTNTMDTDVRLIIYYKYTSPRFEVYAGAFPRRNLKGDYGRAFFSDWNMFYDSTLEGLLMQYSRGIFFGEVGIDWNGRKEGTHREKFMVFSSMRLDLLNRMNKRSHNVYLGYHTTVLHYAGSESVTGVVDNILFYPHIGYTYGNGNGGDILKLRAGWLQAAQRDRQNEGEFVTPCGLQLEAEFKWRKIGLYETLYLGDDIMPYYDRVDANGDEYGSGLYSGETFYRTNSGLYNRIELYWNIYNKNRVSINLSAVHHYDGHKGGWQQVLTFRIGLDNKMKWRKRQ